MTHVHETCDELNTHRHQVREVCAEIGAGCLGVGFAPDLDARRNAGDAQGPLRDHARLHAQGRRLRARDDVPHLHRPGEFRFRLRSRHGEEVPRGAGAAAGRDRALRQFAVPRGQAQRLPVLSQPHLDRRRQRARRHAALRLRGRLRLRALCRLRARCADVFRLPRRQDTSTSPANRSAISWRAKFPSSPGSRR